MLITSTSFLQFCWKNTPKTSPNNMLTTKKIIVVNLLVSVYQISLFAHTHTHSLANNLTFSAGKRNTLLICPPQGFVSSLWNLHPSRQELTWKRNKGPAPCFSLSFSKVYCRERHTALLHRMGLHMGMHTHAHTKGLSALALPQKKHWSDAGVRVWL